MKIGELARRCGLTAHTIRYYERIGLLPYADRDGGRQRDYDASILAWIEFLHRLKTTGMPIRDMLRYAKLRHAGDATNRERRLCWRHIASRSRHGSPVFTMPSPPSMPRSPAMAKRNEGFPLMLPPSNPNPDDRYARGQRALAEIDGAAGQAVIDALADIAPDFARYLFEFPFGDIYSRPGLDLRSREIATIAALAALGHATPQLKVHIRAGLNVGLTQEEIIEILMQMAIYAGFPAALNGLFAAREVFTAAPA